MTRHTVATCLAILILLLVHSSVWVSGQGICDEIALEGLDDDDARVRSEKEGDIRAIAGK